MKLTRWRCPAAGGEPGRGVDRDDPAVVEQRDPVAQALGLLHEVRDEDDRHALVSDALDQRPRVTPGLGIESGGELVEHRELWPADERQRDRQPLALSPGELREARLALAGETEQRQQRRGSAGSR